MQDLKRSTFNNIEHQGIAFVQYSLMPWIIRIEKGIIKDLLLEEEQDVYFPKFNVDGLMRGDYQSRMNAYAIARALIVVPFPIAAISEQHVYVIRIVKIGLNIGFICNMQGVYILFLRKNALVTGFN